MPIPRNLTPEVVSTSNVLLQINLLAVQFESAQEEIDRVNADRNILTARSDMLQPNWGTLLDVGFDKSFTLDQYRNILLTLIRARLSAPSKAALRKSVLAFAPSATIVIRDYFNDSGNFQGPNPATFFLLNGTAAANVWNGQGTVWTPGKLLRQLGYDDFGTQVQVTAVNDADIQFLTFVPAALEYVRPAHQFVALIYTREISAP